MDSLSAGCTACRQGVKVIHIHRPDLADRDLAARRPVQLVLIGTSTGGPKALTDVFQQLPVMPGMACCVVQHMPAGFTRNLARRIDQVSQWTCAEAENHQVVRPGFVYIAPGGEQTRLMEDGSLIRFAVAQTGPINGHQPSVDVLFDSALELSAVQLIGVLMTGMGADGARGLKRLHDAKWLTIAESEDSCVVFGMPRAAMQLNAVDTVVPLTKLAQTIVDAWTGDGPHLS